MMGELYHVKYGLIYSILSLREQALKIAAGLLRHLLHLQTAQLGNLFGHPRHVRGVVGLAPVGHGCEIRAVGLYQHAVESAAVWKVKIPENEM